MRDTAVQAKYVAIYALVSLAHLLALPLTVVICVGLGVKTTNAVMRVVKWMKP